MITPDEQDRAVARRVLRRIAENEDGDSLKDVITMTSPYYLPGRLPAAREQAVDTIFLAALDGARAGREYAEREAAPATTPHCDACGHELASCVCAELCDLCGLGRDECDCRNDPNNGADDD